MNSSEYIKKERPFSLEVFRSFRSYYTVLFSGLQEVRGKTR